MDGPGGASSWSQQSLKALQWFLKISDVVGRIQVPESATESEDEQVIY